jgi:Tol biopolymer transport system component
MPMRPALTAAFAALLLLGAPNTQSIVVTRVFPQPGQIGLFIANADGSGERPLVTPADIDYDAQWSRDGKSIVFTSERNGSADLYRVNVDGAGLERLTDSPAYDDQASFSPDSKRLVFVSSRRDGTADLFTLDLATRVVKPLTSGPGGDFRPSWSPDGQWIAFSSDRASDFRFAHGRWERLQLADIYVIHPDGSGLKQLTPHAGFCGSPRWTADSKRVVAYCMTDEQTLDNRRPMPEHPEDTRIVSIEIASGAMSELAMAHGVNFNPSPLANDVIGYIRRDGPDRGIQYSDGKRGPVGDIRAASWSPDGGKIVFHKRLAFSRKPWVKTFSRDSRYALALVSGGPSFSPSGDQFAFVGGARNAKGAGVAIARAASDTFEIIYRDSTRNILAPQWSPKGDRIIFGIGTFAAFFNGFHGVFLKPEDRVEGGAQVAMINPDGSGYRELTSGPNNSAFPSMSPDGRRFVYRTFGPDGDGLRIMDIETKTTTAIAGGYDNFPLWSPRGDLIMFSRQDQGFYEIYTIKPDGTGLKQLTHDRGNDAHMAWSPDGEYIVFASSRKGFKDEVIYTDAPQPYGDIFVMRFDGSDVRQLTDNQWEEGTPAWQPRPQARAASGTTR